MLNVSLLNKNFTKAVSFLINIRVKNQVITVVKVMTRFMFIIKASNTIDNRFNIGNEIRERSARIMKSTKMVIKMGKSNAPSTRARRDIRSNTII